MALKPVYEELDNKVPYGLLQAISVGIGDVVSDLLQKTLDNVSQSVSRQYLRPPRRLCFRRRLFVCLLAGLRKENYSADFQRIRRKDAGHVGDRKNPF